jgi:RNA-binding protein
MPEPTNPRKKALMPAGPLRKQLRAAGHHLMAIVQVGKEGVTDAVLRQLDQALVDHELVKVKVGTETPEDRFEAAERLGAGCEAQLAQILGRTALVYRRHPDHPKYEPKPKSEPWSEPKTGRTERKTGRTERKTGRTERKTGRTERKTGRTERKTGRTERKTGRTERKTGRTERKPGRMERKPGREAPKKERTRAPRGEKANRARGGPASGARPRAPRPPARRRRG